MIKRWLIIFLVLLAAATSFYLYKIGMFKKLIPGGTNISEGIIEYDITYPKLDPNSMLITGLPNKAYLRFKNDNVVNDMSGMMGLISITYIARSDKSVCQTLTLINKKYAAEISPEDMKRINNDFLEKVEPGNNTKEIAGFSCREILVHLKNGEKFNVFYTEDIGINTPNWSNPYNQVNGVLMDFRMERYGMTMHLTAKQVLEQKVDDKAFQVSEDEFKKIPFEELEKILQELNPVN